MAIHCTNCGKEVSEGMAFCTECGTKLPETEQKLNASPETFKTDTQQIYTPPQTYTQTVQTSAPAAIPTPESAVVGTAAFFGLQLLYAIPIIGWIACLIMTFVPKNKNIKHYARAMLIWIIIGITASVGMFFLLRWAGGIISDYITEITDGAFGGWNDILDQFGEMGEIFEQFGEMGNIMDQLPEGGLENPPME